MAISGGRQKFAFKERRINQLAPVLDVLAAHAQGASSTYISYCWQSVIDEVGTSGGEK